jgi:hypothetical protein
MREETKKRLDRELMKRRLQWSGIGVAMALAAGAGLWFTGLDASVTNTRVAGVVEKVGPLNIPGMTTTAIEASLGVDVKLDDGRAAHVAVLRTSNPEVGQHVEIMEHVHGTGRSTFSWK